MSSDPHWRRNRVTTHPHPHLHSPLPQHVLPIPPVLLMLLRGTVSSTSPLRLLRGQTSTLLRLIYKMYLEMTMSQYFIKDEHAYVDLGEIKFPPPTGIRVTMMPMTLDDIHSFPWTLRHYWGLIQHCSRYDNGGWQKTAYITIHEIHVEKGQMVGEARGLHVESPSLISHQHAGIHTMKLHRLGKNETMEHSMNEGVYCAWSQTGTSALYPCRLNNKYINTTQPSAHIRYPARIHVIENGDLALHLQPSHLSHHVPLTVPGQRHVTQANIMYWHHAQTPMESFLIPSEFDGWYQYFSLVTSRINVWDADIYTQHPSRAVDSDVPIIHSHVLRQQAEKRARARAQATSTSTSFTYVQRKVVKNQKCLVQ